MKVDIPDRVIIPKAVLGQVPLSLRIQILFDLIPQGTYLDIATITETLGAHHVSIRRAISDLNAKGYVLDRRTKPSGRPVPPVELLILPLSQITDNNES